MTIDYTLLGPINRTPQREWPRDMSALVRSTKVPVVMCLSYHIPDVLERARRSEELLASDKELSAHQRETALKCIKQRADGARETVSVVYDFDIMGF